MEPTRRQPDLSDIQTRHRSGPVYVLAFSTLTVAVLGLLTAVLEAPVIFPPLAASAFILFAFPLAEESYPRNVFGSYAIGILGGMAAVAAFGLWGVEPDRFEMRWDRLGASILGMALAVGGITYLRALHVPALAATMMVTLGLIYEPVQFAYTLGFVLITIGISLAINRAFGLEQPLWSGPLVARPGKMGGRKPKRRSR